MGSVSSRNLLLEDREGGRVVVTFGGGVVRRTICALAFMTGLSSPAGAGEVVLGLGYDAVFDSDDGAFAAALDLRTQPLLDLWRFQFGIGAAVEIDSDSDFWGGGGITIALPVTDRFRLEGSVMAGGYSMGRNGTDLGAGPMFRSQAGISYEVMERVRVGVVFEHKSNARSGSRNPGVETILATASYRFDGF